MNFSFDAYQTQTIISFLGIFILGLVTALKEPGNKLNLSAAFFYFTVSLWQLDLYIIKGAHSPEEAALASRILRPAMIMMPVAFLYLAGTLTKTKGRMIIFERIMLAVAVIDVLLNTAGIGVAGFVQKPGLGYVALPDTIYTIYFFIVAFGMAGGFILLIKKYFSRGILAGEKIQIHYLALGIAIGLLGGLTNILTIYGLNVYPMAGFCVLIFLILVTYAIFSHDILNVRDLLQKTIMYCVTAAVIASIYILCGYFILSRINNGVFRAAVFFLITLLITVSVNPVLKVFDRFTKKALLISSYDFQVLLQRVIMQLRLIKDIEPLFARAIESVTDILKLKSSVMFFWDQSKKCYVLYSECKNDSVVVPQSHPLIMYFTGRKDALYYKKIYDDFTYSTRLKKDYPMIDVEGILDFLKKYDAEICLPIFIEGEVKGFWIIGGKRDKSVFQRDEVVWLQNVCSQLSMRVENIMLYDRILSSDRLATLGKISAAVAHEIRNPLTGLSGFVQMALSDRTNKAVMDKFLEIAPGEFKRLEKLTDNLLALSHTAVLKKEDTDITGLIKNVNELMAHTYRDKKITVSEYYADMPRVRADGEQIRQLFLNVIMNAVHAMPGGGVLECRAGSDEQDGRKYAKIIFRDNGRGFDEAVLCRAFEPFFTTRADGTGLGLAISKNIIEAHGGSIKAENDPKGGCAVIICLPFKN